MMHSAFRKRNQAVAAAVAAFFLALSPAAHAKDLLDRIAAVVNGYPLLVSKVAQKVRSGPLVIVSPYPADEEAPPQTKALHDAVNFELILQKAEELGIDVRESEVDAEIASFLENRGLSEQGLRDFLSRQGKSYERYREDFRNQMILRRFQGRVIAPRVQITEKDLKTYYFKKMGGQSEMVELDLRQILIEVDSDAAGEVVEAKRELAQEIHEKLTGGLDFQEAVKVYSDEKGARATGGLMEGIRVGDLAPKIRAAVKDLKIGEFTRPIRTPLGIHVFKLADKKLTGSDAFAQKKKELEFELRNLELTKQTRRWLSEQRQKANIEIVPQ